MHCFLKSRAGVLDSIMCTTATKLLSERVLRFDWENFVGGKLLAEALHVSRSPCFLQQHLSHTVGVAGPDRPSQPGAGTVQKCHVSSGHYVCQCQSSACSCAHTTATVAQLPPRLPPQQKTATAAAATAASATAAATSASSTTLLCALNGRSCLWL